MGGRIRGIGIRWFEKKGGGRKKYYVYGMDR